MSRDGLALRNQAETVAILFEDRLFVWHAFNEPERDPIFGESELGPSVTSNLGDNAYDEVATELERFLSEAHSSQ